MFDRNDPRRSTLAKELGLNQEPAPDAVDSVSELIGLPGLDLVVECASQSAVTAHAEAVLSAVKSMLVMSSGALISPEFIQTVLSAAGESGASIYVRPARWAASTHCGHRRLCLKR